MREQTFFSLAVPPAPWTLHYRVRVTWLTRSGSDKGTSSPTRDRTTQQNRGRTLLRATSIPWILLFAQTSVFWLHSQGEDGEVGLLVLTCTSFPSVVQSIKLFNVDGEGFCSAFSLFNDVGSNTCLHTSANVPTFNYSCSTCLCWRI